MTPFLYTMVSKEQLDDMLESFQTCIDLPIQVIDDKGEIIDSRGSETCFCNTFKKYLRTSNPCEKIHINASKKAMILGETYMSSCHNNLNHIVFPLMNKDVFFGSIIVGPFLMDAPDSLLILNIAKRYSIFTESLLDLYEESSLIKVITPAHVTQISKLLFYLFANLISDNLQQFIINQSKLQQQSKINDSIQMYKYFGSEDNGSYPYEKEKELIVKVKTKNVQEAKEILNQLLGYVFFSEGRSLDILKARAIELCSLLSRAAIEGGAATDSILKINNKFLINLQNINNTDDLYFKLQESIEVFTDSMFNYIPTKNNELIKKAIAYISKNFSKPLTLDNVAEHVHLNPSYFSTIFKQSSGSSFKEYLNMVRIEESKRLLANTDYSVIDIAIAVGFEDQSYFSKVFKKYTGLTPKKYR